MNTPWVFWQGRAVGFDLEAVMQSNEQENGNPIPSFKDNRNREWQVNLSLAAARRIDASDATAVYEKPISILNSQKANEGLFEDLQFNDGLQLFFVWCIIKPQADRLNVSEEDFAESLGPKEIHAAKAALWQGLSDFFPERATYFSRLKDYYRKLYETAAEHLASKGEKILKVAEAEIEKHLNQRLNELSEKAGSAS